MAVTCQFVIDLQNSFTIAKSTEFTTKPILVCPPHLKYVAALPWETLTSEFCTFHACETCFKCYLFIIYPTDMCQIL